MPSVITIGAATQDIFLKSAAFTVMKSSRFATGFAECVTLGEKIEVDDCIITTGGGAANAAVTFARLGFATRIHATIGQDDMGTSITRTLHQEHIDTSSLMTHKTLPSALSILLTTESGERSALVHRGAAGIFQKKSFTAASLQADALYITSLAGNLDVLEHIVNISKKKEAFIAMNPGRHELAHASELRQMLKNISLLLVNKEEAQALVLRPSHNCPDLARMLGKWCPRVVVTDGDRGAWAYESKALWHVAPTTTSPAVSHTGAGDAFGSGTVAGLLKGLSLADAVKVGLLNAQSVIMHLGAQVGILKSFPTPATLAAITVTNLSAQEP